jgi:hypothetical protein
MNSISLNTPQKGKVRLIVFKDLVDAHWYAVALEFNLVVSANSYEEVLSELNSVNFNDIFGNTKSQIKITKVFKGIIHTRERLRAPPLDPAYPGNSAGPGG